MNRTDIYNKVQNHLSHLGMALDDLRFLTDMLASREFTAESVECVKELIVETVDGAEPKCEEIKALVQQW